MLPPRFVQVLLARKENMSYREIGATLGVSAERIRQIEARGLCRISRAHKKANFHSWQYRECQHGNHYEAGKER